MYHEALKQYGSFRKAAKALNLSKAKFNVLYKKELGLCTGTTGCPNLPEPGKTRCREHLESAKCKDLELKKATMKRFKERHSDVKPNLTNICESVDIPQTNTESSKIVIEGYLIHSKLEAVLKRILKTSQWLGSELKVPNSRTRWDMAFKDDSGSVVICEFDGYHHYQDAFTIKRDMEKDIIAKNLGYKVVRFPYWIQLTSETLKIFFGLDVEITQDFPHGFISKKALLPASFCELGVDRFLKELIALPENIKNDVLKSLTEKVKELGEACVFTQKILNYISLK